MTIFQERSPVALRGRSPGTIMASATVATPLGVLLAGVLIDAIGLRPLILGVAAAWLLVTLSTLLNPALRNLDTPDADTSPA